MKPWIGNALVGTGVVGFVALVGDTVGRVQPIEHALVLCVWLLALLYAIAIFATGCAVRVPPPDYENQVRMDGEAERLAERHFGGARRDACTAGTADRDCQPDHGS